MRSKNWSFNKTLFFKNCTRFWPLWVSYAVIWLLSLPGNLFMNMVEDPSDFTGLLRFAQRTVLRQTREMGVLMAAGFGFLCALAVFSYLFFPRAAGLMHTLPIRREGLFLTNYLSGLCFMWVPHLLTAGLLIAAEAAAGVLILNNVMTWLLALCGMSFFFYTFAVLCAMLTGNVLAMPALYVIFNCVVYVLYLLLNQLICMFSFGYIESPGFNRFAMWFTPVGQLLNELRVESIREDVTNTVLDYRFLGAKYVAVYAAVGVVLLVAALLLYRRRHIESAGDVIAVNWLKPIFKYSFAFCAALCGSWVLYHVFFRTLLPEFLALALPMALCALLGCFFGEMFLQKSFKVFRKGWVAALIFTAVMVGGLFGISRDVFGFETQIPDLEDVTDIRLDLNSLPPHDKVSGIYDTFGADEPERMEAIHLIHHTIIQNRDLYEDFSFRDAPYDGRFFYINIEYHLKNGTTLRRQYSVPVSNNSQAVTPTSLEGRLLALVRDPELMMEYYFGEHNYVGVANARLDVYNPNTKAVDIIQITNPEALEALYAAVRADVAAGRLGIRYLSDYDPDYLSNCAVNALQMDLLFNAVDTGTGKEYLDTRYVPINLQFSATETLRVLQEMGVFTETQTLYSQAEAHSKDGYYYTDDYWEKYDALVPQVVETTAVTIYD